MSEPIDRQIAADSGGPRRGRRLVLFQPLAALVRGGPFLGGSG